MASSAPAIVSSSPLPRRRPPTARSCVMLCVRLPLRIQAGAESGRASMTLRRFPPRNRLHCRHGFGPSAGFSERGDLCQPLVGSLPELNPLGLTRDPSCHAQLRGADVVFENGVKVLISPTPTGAHAHPHLCQWANARHRRCLASPLPDQKAFTIRPIRCGIRPKSCTEWRVRRVWGDVWLKTPSPTLCLNHSRRHIWGMRHQGGAEEPDSDGGTAERWRIITAGEAFMGGMMMAIAATKQVKQVPRALSSCRTNFRSCRLGDTTSCVAITIRTRRPGILDRALSRARAVPAENRVLLHSPRRTVSDS